jgi:uncharacterized protein (DUF433 family)
MKDENYMQKTKGTTHPYVVRNSKICGGVPIIKGTRIRVIDIAIEYERLGMTPDEILEAHPHIQLKQVHNALSFYYENREAIDKEIQSRLKDIDDFQKEYETMLPK